MILDLYINKPKFKCACSADWQFFSFHIFIWHLCFAITISDYSKYYCRNSIWKGWAICWDWVTVWVDGAIYKNSWEVILDEIDFIDLDRDEQLRLGMSGII